MIQILNQPKKKKRITQKIKSWQTFTTKITMSKRKRKIQRKRKLKPNSQKNKSQPKTDKFQNKSKNKAIKSFQITPKTK